LVAFVCLFVISAECVVVSSGLKALTKGYDAFIIDQWGVLHDGKKLYSGVLEALQMLKKEEKRLIMLSNSSKRRSESLHKLQAVGIDDSIFENVVTSGELAWNSIKNRSIRTKSTTNANEPLNTFCFGNGDDDDVYMSSSGCKSVPIPEEAHFVLARGMFSVGGNLRYTKAQELMDAVEPWLFRCVAMSLPMLVSNPDWHRPGGMEDPMPGQIAARYASLLEAKGVNSQSLITYVGKPYMSVFSACFALLDGVPKERICMIGDALGHDCLGARNSGIDSIFVQNGVHSSSLGTKEGSSESIKSEAQLENLFEMYQVLPTHVIRSFAW